jgi:hypothetical protein
MSKQEVKMKTAGGIKIALIALLVSWVAGCGSGEPDFDVQEMLARPKTYIGSNQCRVCHLEHYDSWMTTLHSRTIQDVTDNLDAIVADIDPNVIRADLKKGQIELKAPVDEIYIPNTEDIKYTIGVQWKQMYLVEKNKVLYLAPIQYNIWSDRWIPYHEEDWDERPWAKLCGGCHAMNVDIQKGTFSEARVGCEACHGPGSHHAALPKTAVFGKRQTIVNPSELPAGLRTQICGSCHGRGMSTKVKGAEWPVGYRPGRALGMYYRYNFYDHGQANVKEVYANEFAKGHRQQYNDWKLSSHAREGVSCTSCHYVHQLGVPPTQFQTRGSGSQQCMACHKVINNNLAHSIHSFANCIGCHMPRIAKSAESGDIHSHAFVALLPEDTLKNPGVPNSCQTCHKHRDTDLKTLQELYESVTKKTLVKVHGTR